MIHLSKDEIKDVQEEHKKWIFSNQISETHGYDFYNSVSRISRPKVCSQLREKLTSFDEDFDIYKKAEDGIQSSVITNLKKHSPFVRNHKEPFLNPNSTSYYSKESNGTISGNFFNLYIDPNSIQKNNSQNNTIVFTDKNCLLSHENFVIPQKELNPTGEIHGTYLFKVLLVGDPSTGKTSMVHRYVHGQFSRDYKATLGVDFALKVVRWSDNVTMKLQLWDIAGQERFTSMTRVYYKDAHACIIMFDLTQRGSFLNALKWKKDLDQKCSLPDGKPVPCVLLANKCDLGCREVDQTEIEAFCQCQDFIGWTETSVKDSLMVEESMRFLLDDMIGRYAERNPGLTDSEALDLDRRSNVYLKKVSEVGLKNDCAC